MNCDKNFIAIDFETATGKRHSICEVGICVVIHGQIIETRSWLVRPEDNIYHYWNIQIHGITPKDTEDAPQFDQVWEEIERTYLDEFLEENSRVSEQRMSGDKPGARSTKSSETDRNLILFVAHNAAFDRSCLNKAAEFYNIHLPELRWDCSCNTARRIYNFGCNSLGYLCDQLGIPEGTHHRAGDDAEMCARLYLRELEDMQA